MAHPYTFIRIEVNGQFHIPVPLSRGKELPALIASEPERCGEEKNILHQP
jgi:hypothetical protein